jgi:hypothetical protein
MSDLLLAIGGGGLALAGATLVYLAAPNQRLAVALLSRRTLAGGGLLTLLIALALLLGVAGPTTAVFIWMTLAMTVWSIVPLAAAWARRPKENAR